MLSVESWTAGSSKLVSGPPNALLAAFFRDPRQNAVATPQAPPPILQATAPAAEHREQRVGSLDISPTAAHEPWRRAKHRIPRGVQSSSSSRSSSEDLASRNQAGLDVTSTRPARPPRPPRPTREAPAYSQPAAPRATMLQNAATSSGGMAATAGASSSPLQGGDFSVAAALGDSPGSPRSGDFEEFAETAAVYRGFKPSLTLRGNVLASSSAANPAAAADDTRRIAMPAGVGTVQALSVIVQDMLQMKYGLSLDSADFERKVKGHCSGMATDSGATSMKGSESIQSPTDLVTQLNAHPDLRFKLLGSDCIIAVRVESCIVPSFAELQQEVRRMPGTARALAVVELLHTEANSYGDEGHLHTVAVFREDYARPNMLISRDLFPASAPLVAFGVSGLLGAITVDPVVTKVFRRVAEANGSGDLQELAVPVLREEYANLGVWILPEEEQLAMPSSFEVGHVASCPWPHVLEAAMSEEGGPAPTQRWMRKLRRVLEHPDASGEAVLAFVIQLAGWLGGIDDVASGARQAILTSGLQPGLVAALRRGGGNELVDHGLRPETAGSSYGGHNGNIRRLDLAVAVQASRVIALASKGFPEGAAAFSREDAVPAACGLLHRWTTDGDVQLQALLALQHLVEEDDLAASQAYVLGAVRLARSALQAHPRNPELQRHGARAAQVLAMRGDAVGPPQASAEYEDAEEDDDSSRPSRKGIAAALLEKRAADAKPTSMVSAAVGWLFSATGRDRGRGGRSSSVRQGRSEPPTGRVAVNGVRPLPAPCLPAPPSVPRLDLRTVGPIQAQNADSYRIPAAAVPQTAGVSTTGATGRRATSRPAPMVATAAHDTPSSPREESPLTPSVVRLQRAAQESGSGPHGTLVVDSEAVGNRRPRVSPRAELHTVQEKHF